MKKFYFLLIAVIAGIFTASAGKVYFTNPKNWSKVNCHYWGGTSTATNWPGVQMTKDGDLWTIETVGEPTGIIFNNGSGAQTADLQYVAGATYDMNGPVGVVNPTWTTYYDNSLSNWSEVYVYTYNGVCTGTWPGTKMTKQEDGLYKLEFQAAFAPEKIIFNNNSGSQTADLDFENEVVYNMAGKRTDTPIEPVEYTVFFDNTNTQWEKVMAYAWGPSGSVAEWPGQDCTLLGENLWQYSFETLVAPTQILFHNGDGLQTVDFEFADNTTYFVKAAPVNLYMVGDFNGWSNGNENSLFTKDGNEYTYEVEQEISGEFKVTNGTWDYNFGSGLADGEKNVVDVAQDSWFNGGNFKYDVPSLPEGQIVASTKVVFNYVEGSDEAGSSIPSKLTLSYRLTTGIEIVAEEAAAPVYYNLQGVKVQNPENGVFIRVAAGKAVKVVL